MIWFDLQHSPGHSVSPVFLGPSHIGFNDMQFSSSCDFRKTHFTLFLAETLHLIKETSQNCCIV